MGAEHTGLTLEGLARRLEALERENTELRSKVATLEGSGTRRDELAENRGSERRLSGEVAALAFDGQVSRRLLLSKAGAAAVAAVAAGTLLSSPRKAKADHYGPGIEVDYVRAHSDQGTAVNGIAGPGGIFGVYGRAESPSWAGVAGRNSTEGGIGVDGSATSGTGVYGNGNNGVHGRSIERGWAGVYGNNITDYGFGVVGDGSGDDGAGVLGRNDNQGADGVQGKGGRSGVYGEGRFGVFGNGQGAGVYGTAQSQDGVAIMGNALGYGGLFNGGKAQLWLQPGASADRPTSGDHNAGELYMDSNATLFVCTAGGNPGVWRMVQTAPA